MAHEHIIHYSGIMPELPEVQTTVNGLKKYTVGENILTHYISMIFKIRKIIEEIVYYITIICNTKYMRSKYEKYKYYRKNEIQCV
jgi:formamidopyrimidine-DNA glycosylase